jgi:hypothetical protein
MSDGFLSSSIERELGSGERLLWKGRPRGGVRLRGSDVFLIPFSLLWGGFAIFWESIALFAVPKNNAAGWIAPLFGLPFVLVGLYIIFGRFFVDAKMRQKTEYALTGRRAIIVSGLFSRKVRSVSLQSTPEVTLTEKADGSGTITFGAASPFSSWVQQNTWSAGASQQPAFEMIDNVRSVYDLIQKALRA